MSRFWWRRVGLAYLPGMKWLSNMWKNRQEASLFVVFVALAILVGWLYIPFYNNGWCKYLGCIDGVDTDPTRTALALAGAVLVIGNMLFIAKRMQKTNEQIKKTSEQIEGQNKQLREQQHANFLASLRQGIDMLYSGNFVTQRGGVEYLHSLVEANKENPERVKEVFEALRVFVKEIPVDKEKKTRIEEEEKFSDVVIKQEILYKIRNPKEDTYSGVRKFRDKFKRRTTMRSVLTWV